ncbi:MAG: site-specific integrase [Acidobacteriota bacterium]
MRRPVGYVTRRTRNGKKRWVARIAYTDKETGRLVERLRVATTKHEADALLDDLRDEYRKRGRIEIDRRLATFSDLAKVYEEARVFPAQFHKGRKTAGLKSHLQVKVYLEVLKGYFGHRRLKEIRHSDLIGFRRERLRTPTRGDGERSIASVNREMEQLRAMLRFAIREGFIEHSPFEGGETLIEKKHETRRDRVMTLVEETRLLDACVGRYEHLRPLIIAGVDLGMRSGELFLMTWGDVDFNQNLITIKPENEKANRGRTAAMTGRVRDELLRLREASEERPDGLVFGITSSVKNGWRAICKTAEVTDLRFHDLRHTCVTRLVAAGVPAAAVMKSVGHTTLSMLSRYLSHGENQQESATKLEEYLQSKSKDKPAAELVN